MTDQPIPLADLDAHGLLDHYGATSPAIDSVALNYVDDRTILAVGYGGVSKGRRVATGRVAWLIRDLCPTEGEKWIHERRLISGPDREIDDPLASLPTSSWDIDTAADLDVLIAWLKGGSA